MAAVLKTPLSDVSAVQALRATTIQPSPVAPKKIAKFKDAAYGKALSRLPNASACPFCGVSDVVMFTIAASDHHVQCNGCFAEGPPSASKLEAAETWNNAAKTRSSFKIGPFIEGLANKPDQDVELSDLDAVATRLDVPLWVLFIPGLSDHPELLQDEGLKRLQHLVENYLASNQRDRRGLDVFWRPRCAQRLERLSAFAAQLLTDYPRS